MQETETQVKKERLMDKTLMPGLGDSISRSISLSPASSSVSPASAGSSGKVCSIGGWWFGKL